MNAPNPEEIQVIIEKVAGQAEQPIPWVLITFILFGAAIVSWGITEAIKKTAQGKWKYDHEGASTADAKKALWWAPMLVIVSIVIGTLLGGAVAAFQWQWLYGALVGACGGALASFLVKLFKSNLKSGLAKATGVKPEPTVEVDP